MSYGLPNEAVATDATEKFHRKPELGSRLQALKTSKMYQKSKSLHTKGSASLLYNNLSVLAMPEKNMASYGVVHKSSVCLVNCSNDTMNVNHKQVSCKEPSAAVSQGTMILQVCSVLIVKWAFSESNMILNLILFTSGN